LFYPSNKRKILDYIFRKLYRYYGPQHWWPGEDDFEIIVGAILAQNTNWRNVESAIYNMKNEHCLSLEALKDRDEELIKKMIRPVGFFNIKSERLKRFIDYMVERFGGDIALMKKKDTKYLREEMLKIKGIGPETCDSILLYALEKPVFVVDAYTRRIFSRHNIVSERDKYDNIRLMFERNLKKDAGLFNEYHALIVKLAKDKCKKKNPDCKTCPIVDLEM
jgi:endonuclease-3 related protein